MPELKTATLLAGFLAIATLSSTLALADITGPAIVTDGDTIKIDGQLTSVPLRSSSGHSEGDR
jgi:hypothetical protein